MNETEIEEATEQFLAYIIGVLRHKGFSLGERTKQRLMDALDDAIAEAVPIDKATGV
jgi:hypothetical protein